MSDETVETKPDTTPETPANAPVAPLTLTDEEQAAIVAARAKAAQEAADAAERIAAAKARERSPDDWIGIDRGANGRIDYVKHPEGVRAKARDEDGSKAHRDLTVTVDGKRYDHVGTDVHGIWLYR